jgi:hypothetical protein
LQEVNLQLLGMEVAQALGVPTLNGYSAHAPQGWRPFRRWSDLDEWKLAVRCCVREKVLRRQSWYDAHGFEGLIILGSLHGSSDARRTPCLAPLPAEAFQARLRLARPLPRLVAGTPCALVLEVTNQCPFDWPALSWNGFQFRVGAAQHWFRPDGEELTECSVYRSWLDEDVPAGGTTLLAVELTPPETPGRYRVQLDLLQEEVAWFSEYGCRPLCLDLDVEPATLPGAPQ